MRNARRSAERVPPDDDGQDSSGKVTERSPLKPKSEAGLAKTATRRAAIRGPESRSRCAGADSDEESAESDRESAASAASAATPDSDAPVSDSPTPAAPKAKRRLGLNAGGGILKRAGRRGAANPTGSASAEEEHHSGDADAEECASSAAPASAQRAAERGLEQTAARLAVGLTERVRPRFTPPAAQVLAESAQCVLPRVGVFNWLGSEADGATFTRPMAELYDGLYVEEMPPSSTRSLQVCCRRGLVMLPCSSPGLLGTLRDVSGNSAQDVATCALASDP